MIFRAVLFVVFLVLNVTSREIRLPKTIQPIRYYLTLEPQFQQQFKTPPYLEIPFEGSVTIELNVLENTKSITLNAALLEIKESNITIVDKNENILEISSASGDSGTYTIHLENELVEGNSYILHIGWFKGSGFLKSDFSKFRNERHIAVTHFYPSDARRRFPCFDEPSFKAKFIVSLIRTAEYNSVSTEDLDKTEDLGDGRFKDTFKETPLLSTYTLAFAVTDYKYSEKLDRHRILAPPKVIDHGSWKLFLDAANQTLKALEEYTGIDFVSEKIDHIILPLSYFNEYTMANWGLIVHRDSNLIGSDTVDYQRGVCNIAHTFAYQWFGNLVTPAWWDNLWLSDSFAAYFRYYIADMIDPSWRLNEQFLVDMVQEALYAETRKGAYPINTDSRALYPEVRYRYISHEKGASIIRMMEHFLTHDVFRRGLQIFLAKNKFGNVLSSDLYAAFHEAAKNAGTTNLLHELSVAEIMKSWENNKGFPIITVTRNYKTGELTLEQEARFKEDDNTTITKWNVPINYIFSANGKLDFTETSPDYWLTETRATVNHNFPTGGWVIVDKQATGYYRVNYDLENWKRIIETLRSSNFESINVLNRAKLIDDAFNLAYLGKLPWDIPASLHEYIIQEKDYIALNPFYRALHNLNYMSLHVNKDENPTSLIKFLQHTKSKDLENIFKEYVNTTLAGVINNLGLDETPDDSYLDKIHRDKFVNTLDFMNFRRN